MDLLKNPHLELISSQQEEDVISCVSGDYEYWHYLCDSVDDRGWGCGYRTLQTMISWCVHNRQTPAQTVKAVPSIRQIQEILVGMEDKPSTFLGSRDWIGSVEVALVIDSYCDVPVRLLHLTSGDQLESVFNELTAHFDKRKCCVMMGGDQDCSSKGVFGTRQLSSGEKFLLIVDPHYVGTSGSKSHLVSKGWISWVNLKDFMSSSFYNLALPQT